MATLHLLAGKAGSGKTTLARRLAHSEPAIVICEDEWMARLVDDIGNVQEYMTAARRIRSITAPLVEELLRLGTSVVCDFAGNTRRERLWLRSIAERAGASVTLHYIRADDSVCRERVLQRNATRPEGVYFGDVTIEQLEEVNRFFEEPADEEGFAVMIHGSSG